ncbi:hypothetical protein BDR22DRAFT_862551 [Usnea florida]
MIRCEGVNSVSMEDLRSLRDDACGLPCFFFFGFRGPFFVSWFIGQSMVLAFTSRFWIMRISSSHVCLLGGLYWGLFFSQRKRKKKGENRKRLHFYPTMIRILGPGAVFLQPLRWAAASGYIFVTPTSAG